MAAEERAFVTVRRGVGLATLGGLGAVLDVLFAECNASGPCQPVPPIPIIIPLVVFAIGVAFVLGKVWLWSPKNR